MRQALREELRPQNIEVVTVALDTGGAEAAGSWIDAAKPQHPSLIDAGHRLDPVNWTYRRQAWSFEDPLQGPTEHYDGDWLTDVRAAGPESYYPVPDL